MLGLASDRLRRPDTESSAWRRDPAMSGPTDIGIGAAAVGRGRPAAGPARLIAALAGRRGVGSAAAAGIDSVKAAGTADDPEDLQVARHDMRTAGLDEPDK